MSIVTWSLYINNTSFYKVVACWVKAFMIGLVMGGLAVLLLTLNLKFKTHSDGCHNTDSFRDNSISSQPRLPWHWWKFSKSQAELFHSTNWRRLFEINSDAMFIETIMLS